MTQLETADLQKAALDIEDRVLTAERATNHAAEATALLIATMLSKRAELRRPISTGAREIDRAHQALTRSLGSLRALAMMHGGLHVVADEEGVVSYGTTETVPNQPGGHLRAA